ncbi:hypothetical protein Clacol_005357 [Clathrus columnatus]|uniref:NACHT domain-containing protein n=1 Tax=Clathrus columnatus TaxID=1419009 RepID=A0AAV5ADP8_9AGAM|nr:hypothetical protein Clacol_005357 [Clathrus columnatus]
MKKFLKKPFQKFSKKKHAHEGSDCEIVQQTSSNNDSQHARPNSILTSDNELDRGKLDDSMQEVSQVLEGTRDITGKHLESNNKAYRYKEVASNVVQRLSAFINLVQSIADAHPHAKMAWAIISGFVNVIVYTQDIDQNILDLFETVDATYKFIEETKEVENRPSYKRILSTLAKQTVECAYFIRDYAKVANFWIRVGKNVIGGPIKTRVQTYQTVFSRLLAEFRTHSSLHTELAVGRVLESNQEICEVLYLDSLPYAAGAGLNTGKQCLLGTRVGVLDEISNWINDGDENCPRLFWLAGPAGVGKSAIAHSIAIRFESIGRLGSFFCFDRNYPLERRRDKVFSTIARDLADLDVQIKHELAKVIRNKTSLRTTTDLHLQWKNFIFEPLKAISEASTGPILIILDALDECDNPSSRQDLLKVLETGIRTLPVNVRLLITSRPENDIKITFKKLESHIRTKMMDTIPESESERDILAYLKANLDSLGEAQLTDLVRLSQGLFQWAYLASQFLKGLGNSAGLTVTERYRKLIGTDRIQSINDTLDFMYTQILSSLFDADDSLVMTRFRLIIGSIIASSEPLSLKTLVALHGDRVPSSNREEDIKVVIQYMGSLLSGIDDSSSTIRPLHLSFREYLLDLNRSHKFSINLSLCHHDFAVGCIRTMMEGLRFNICDIPDSYEWNINYEDLPKRVSSSMMKNLPFNIWNIPDSHERNNDYEDLPKWVSSKISIPLFYSCRFWALHVSGMAFDSSLARKIEEFFYHQFLLWLEVLSLVKSVNMAAKLMSHLISWSSRGKTHKRIYDFAVDGKRFVELFSHAITTSAPHIYLSALPFCPQNSLIYKTYIKQFPNTLRIASDPICDWSFASIVSDVSDVECIAFSHGGKSLAVTLSYRGIFGLLNSGNILWAGEVPDNEHIHAIQFSSDDRTLIIVTSTKVYLFDILSNDLMLHRKFPHTYGKLWETKLSPNAIYVIFHHESSLTIWNMETEETVDIPFDSTSRTSSFEFLNNSGYLVTYSLNIGVQVWDLGTGILLHDHGPFRSPKDVYIYYAKISPNGKDIFLFSHDARLYKWNFQDKSFMTVDVRSQPSIDQIHISPNGECIITESEFHGELILILRDMNGNELHCGIYRNSLSAIRIAFSEDGKRLASCDKEGLKIWKLDGWQTTPNIRPSALPPPHSLEFRNVSSDGKYFLAQNWVENRHEIWDVELGRLIQKLNHCYRSIFSPSNRYLAYISDKKIPIIYDIHSGITKELLSNDKQILVEDLAFSQDEMCIATLDPPQGRIHVWDVASWQIVDTLMIPKANSWALSELRASSNFRYFAYADRSDFKSDIFLVSRTRTISVESLIPGQVCIYPFWAEDFLFDLDEEHLAVSRGSNIFYIDLITEEHRVVTLRRAHISDDRNSIGQRRRRSIHSMSSSDTILVEIYIERGYNIWNASSGQLLYSGLLEHPDIVIKAFIPVHRYFFTETDSVRRILTLDAKRSDLICFSPNEQHSLKNSLLGSSASRREDGWVITQNNELLFWVPKKYHETFHTQRLKYIVGGKSTELDLSSFSHGKSWASCRASVDNTISE